MDESHVSSLIIHVKPDRIPEVRAEILAAGAEIPAEDPRGKLVAVIETDSESAITDFATTLAVREGVLSTNLVFHHVEEISVEQTALTEQRVSE